MSYAHDVLTNCTTYLIYHDNNEEAVTSETHFFQENPAESSVHWIAGCARDCERGHETISIKSSR